MKPRKSPTRTRREALGLRREKVAADADISVQSLWAIETGRTANPGLDVARRLAAALSTTVDALFPPDPDAVVKAPIYFGDGDAA